MAQRIEKKEEYILTRKQFEARKASGQLVPGSKYHITDDPTVDELLEGKIISKKAEQDASGNNIVETYRRKDDSYSSKETQDKLDLKLNAVSTTANNNRVYVARYNGEQMMIEINPDSPQPRSIVQRDDNGGVIISEPTLDKHATSKNYVDTAIDNLNNTINNTILTNLNALSDETKDASRIDKGILADDRLSDNIAKKNINNFFSTNQTITGNLTVIGNIYQGNDATVYETHTEKILSENDYIILRNGAQTALGDDNYSGLEFTLYNGVSNARLGIDNKGIVRVGDVGDEQPLLTRLEADSLTDTNPLVWDAATLTAKTSDEFVRKTDFANASVGGVVKAQNANNVNRGVYISTEGFLSLKIATDNEIKNKTNTYNVISPQNLDKAVATSISTNTIELTDDEKTSAQTWLGLNNKLEAVTSNYSIETHRVYAVGTSGTQYILRTTDNTSNELTTKAYVDNADATKVSQVEYSKDQTFADGSDGGVIGRVYMRFRDNTENSIVLNCQNTKYTIPVRDSTGNFYVGNPQQLYHTTNKTYVDNLVATKLTVVDNTGKASQVYSSGNAGQEMINVGNTPAVYSIPRYDTNKNIPNS